MVGEVGDEAAVVGLEKGLEDQTGEQLGLGKLLGTEAVGIGRQGLGGHGQGLPRDPKRGFGKFAHVRIDLAQPGRIRGFLQSRSGVDSGDIAEQPDAVDRAGFTAFRGMKPTQPARQLIRTVRRHTLVASRPGTGGQERRRYVGEGSSARACGPPTVCGADRYWRKARRISIQTHTSAGNGLCICLCQTGPSGHRLVQEKLPQT